MWWMVCTGDSTKWGKRVVPDGQNLQETGAAQW